MTAVFLFPFDRDAQALEGDGEDDHRFRLGVVLDNAFGTGGVLGRNVALFKAETALDNSGFLAEVGAVFDVMLQLMRKK